MNDIPNNAVTAPPEPDATCSMCAQKSPRDIMETKQWLLVKITEHKKRAFGTLGFPSSGTALIQGWKFREVCRFCTLICPNCLSESIAEQRRTDQANKVAGKWLIVFGTLLAVVSSGIMGGLFAFKQGFSDRSNLFQVVMILICVGILAALLGIISRAQPEPKRTDLHFKCVEPEARKYQPEGKLLTEAPSISRPYVGDFCVLDQITLDTCQKGDGWPVIHASWKADATATSGAGWQDYDVNLLHQSMKNMGFENPGSFLNAGPDGSTHRA